VVFVQPVNQRQGFLVSTILHLTILMILVSRPYKAGEQRRDEADPTQYERKDTVFLPPPAVLKQLAPRPMPPRAAPTPRPAPTPPPEDASKKDRISVGPPSDLQAKGPMILRREDDLTAVSKGVPKPPQVAPAAPPPTPSTAPRGPQAADAGGSKAVPGAPGLRLPPGLGRDLPAGQEGAPARPGPLGESIAEAMRQVERRIARDAQLGIPTGTGQNIGGLFFDPQGADFTRWVNHFKNEVYRNWIMPQPALLGFKGRVDFEFTVERDGTMSGLRLVRSSGTVALDRAAQNALSSSRFLVLPDDFGPPRVKMQVTFFYNEGPEGS
jgi:periplasmic protein TonB